MGIISYINKALFPIFCLYCNKPGQYICLKCFNNLQRLALQECIYCHRYSINGDTHKYCLKINNTILIKHLSPFEYNDSAQKISLLAKSGFNSYKIYDQLINSPESNELIKRIINEIDFVTHAPLNKSLINNRIVNHSEYIALQISRRYKVKHLNLLKYQNYLYQKKNKNLSYIDRFTNSKFTVKKHAMNIKHKKILFIDDISTSGSTIINCSQALKEQKVSKVYAFTLFKKTRN